MKENAVSAGLAVVLAGAMTLFGGWTTAMTTLVMLIALDIVSGFGRAFIQKQLSSKESWFGVTKKLLVFVAVALGAQIDVLLGNRSLVRDAVVAFYCASEGLSVVENLVASGLPVPEQLRLALKQLNSKKYVE